MKFVSVATAEAEGALLAHAIRRPGLFLPKGQPLDAASLLRLRNAGLAQVTVARLEPGDAPEDLAAARAARGLAGAGVSAQPAHTGRVNLCADRKGLLLFEPERVHALNRIDEAITLATLPFREPVAPGQMVATVKVNPYAVADGIVAAWEAAPAPFVVAPFRPLRASLIQTVAPGLKASVFDKTARVTKERMEALGGFLVADLRADHALESLALVLRERVLAGDDLVLICGASSIADRDDVVPGAIVASGGEIIHFGMPVDPGNLLALGAVGSIPVIGMPGCARTPQLNGFDYVLRLVMAGISVGPEDIGAMGVGGLLKGAPWRQVAPEPARAPRIAALVLAAGRSSRMGDNKLTMPLEGKPVLRHVVDAVSASRVASVHVVLGHQSSVVRALFGPGEARFVRNEDYRQGLSTSLKAGIASLPDDVDAALVCLGDMPDLDPSLIDRMIAGFDPAQMRAIVLPKRGGRRGHPVLWGRRFFPILLEKTSGDTGAKHLLGAYADWIVEIDAGDDGVFTDLDTPDAFARRRKHGEMKILAASKA